jgi:putative hydrolase of the HAD superfamily
MQKVENIIFDLGGVFLEINYQLTQKAFEDLGVAHFKKLFTQHYSSDVFELLETGKISPSSFYDAFRKEAAVPLSDAAIEKAWNAMLGGFPKERLDWLKQIKNKYKIFLFSNTNQIHYDAYLKIYEKTFGSSDFNNQFIHAYYSHELGLRKPTVESFQFILNEQNLVAANTLFIDDTLINIEGAQKAGLQTIHLAPPLTIFDLNL